MLMLHTPPEACRPIDCDADVEVTASREYAGLCYEQLLGAIGTAIFAHERGDRLLADNALTRALSALMALRLGIGTESAVPATPHRLFETASCTILDSVMDFDALALSRLREAIRDDMRRIADLSA